MKNCPFCRSEIDAQATVCPVCKRNIIYQKVSGIAIFLALIIFAIPAYFIIKGIGIIDNHIQSEKQYETGGYSSYSELSFKTIIEAKKNNLSNAVSLYEDKTFIFQGKIKSIGEAYFTIEYDYKGLGYNFDIYWLKSQKSKANALKKGQNVKFYAVIDDLNPLFGYCRIEKAVFI